MRNDIHEGFLELKEGKVAFFKFEIFGSITIMNHYRGS